jgi:hypothetical protein
MNMNKDKHYLTEKETAPILLAAAKMMPEAAVVAPGWRVSAEMFS